MDMWIVLVVSEAFPCFPSVDSAGSEPGVRVRCVSSLRQEVTYLKVSVAAMTAVTVYIQLWRSAD